MIPSVTVENIRGSVHDGSHITVEFVGITALVTLVLFLWDHSVYAGISLGHPVHPRPFRWWTIYGGYFRVYHFGLLFVGNPTGRKMFLDKVFYFRVFPLFLFVCSFWWIVT